jgi:excinuclease ABC subunit A
VSSVPNLLQSIPGLGRATQHDEVVVHGARTHNLRGVNVRIPRNRLVVLTGPSGSGKSSLAFDTLYAEGQRRYVESLSPYARQFLDQLEKPDVDAIDGLSPALSIEQRSIGRSPRSTVGTATEISDYLRLLFARAGHPHCPDCGSAIAPQTLGEMTDRVLALAEGSRVQILAPVIRGRKGAYRKELEEMRRRGYVYARIDGVMRELEEDIQLARQARHEIEFVVDRLIVRDSARSRIEDSLQTALELADGLAIVLSGPSREAKTKSAKESEWLLSRSSACAECGISLPEIAPRLFSFNNPAGACPDCDGLGVIPRFEEALIISDPAKPLREAIEPWQQKRNARYYAQVLADLAEHLDLPLDTSWEKLPPKARKLILSGEPRQEIAFSVGEKPTRSGRPRKTKARRAWLGVIDELQRREDTKLERFQQRVPCEPCGGARLCPEARSVRLDGRAIHELCALSIADLRIFLEGLEERLAAGPATPSGKLEVAGRVGIEIRERLAFLADVGLDYLSLDRPSATLSGGEAQRIRLATQIGSSMLGVLYILDEPSIGLHARDNARLLASLVRLRDNGNSVVVVEHDEATIRSADHVIDMGPGAGIHGGHVVAQGSPDALAKNPDSPTGAWLAGRESIAPPDATPRRRQEQGASIQLRGCRANNLKGVDLEVKLGTLTVVTGVSGSGKSSLVNTTLQRALSSRLYNATQIPGDFDSLEGEESIEKLVNVDQSPIGRTPRSNPATYSGVFGGIRQLFSQVPESRARGYEPGRFSFNVAGGRCEACQGGGSLRVEMHFLPDLFVTCEVCAGRRYNQETLGITYKGRSIADVLEMTAEEAVVLMENVPSVRRPLQALIDVGLEYVRLGQPATTLSGGEAQRVKLARELARRSSGRTLYLLDEPTTGLHLSDVKRLLELLQRLVDRGNTVLVIEHHLDVIKSADVVIDMGPEGGAGGGEIVVSGSPREVADSPKSHTGKALAELFASK